MNHFKIRRSRALAGAIIVALGGSAASAQMLYEPFDYGSDNLTLPFANTGGTFVGFTNPTSGLNWASSSSSAPSDTTIIAAGSLPQVSGLSANVGDTAGSDSNRSPADRQPRIAISPSAFLTPGQSIYYSMSFQLPDLSTLTSTGSYIIGGFNNASGAQAGSSGIVGARLVVRRDAEAGGTLNKFNVGIASAGGTPTFAWEADAGSPSGFKQYLPTDTIFVVGSYTFVGAPTSTDDVHSLWINPNSSTFGAGTAPAPTLSTTGGDIPQVLSFLIRPAGVANAPQGTRYDEIRADTTWAQVTPPTGSTFTGASSTAWSDSSNWNGGTPNANAAFAYFNGAGGTVDVDAGHTAGTLTFRSAAAYTVSGAGTITLNADTGGTSAINVQAKPDATTGAISAVNHTISAPISLQNDVAVHVGPSQTLTVSGGVSGTGNISKDNTGALDILGGLSQTGSVTVSNGTLNITGSSTFTGGINVTGGQLYLGGTNTFAGGVSMTGGNIMIESNAALGSGNLFLARNGTNAGVVQFGSSTTIDSSKSITIKNIAGGNGPQWDTQAFDVTIDSNISGGGGTVNLLKNGGTGTLNLRGDNSTDVGGSFITTLFVNAGKVNVTSDVNMGQTVAGGNAVANPIQLNGGTLQFGASFAWAGRNISVGSSGGGIDTPSGIDQTIDSVITGAAPFTKSGVGRLVLSGANTHTGNEIVAEGTLQATKPAALNGYATLGKVTVDAGATLAVNAGGAGEWAAGDVDTLLTNATINGSLGFDTTNAGGTFTYGTAMSGAMGVTKLGTGTLDLTSNTHSWAGDTKVDAGTLKMTRIHSGTAVTLAAGTTLQVVDSTPTFPSHPAGDDAQVSQPKSLTIGTGATLDLGNNDMIIDYSASSPYGGTSPAAAIEALIAQGFNAGDWLGTGITSSAAASVDAAGNFVLGIADNATLPQPYGVTNGGDNFSGVDVPVESVLVKFTHRADINLDGLVTDADAILFSTNYEAGSPATWSIGDLDYDGVFSDNDSIIFGTYYDTGLAHLPEPASIGVLGIAAAGLLARRRRTA